MTAVTHILETLLDKLRRQEMTLTDEMASVLHEAGDVIARQSAVHREGGKVDANAVSAMCARLERFLTPEESGNNSASMARGNKNSTAEQPDNPDYGFFGQQPQIRPDTDEQEDQEDYGFFKKK